MRRAIILTLCVILLATSALAADTVITDMKTDCQIDGSGVCRISQTVTVEIGEILNELTFPLGKNARHGSVAGYATKKSEEDDCTVLTLRADAGLSGLRTYTVTYELENLISEENEEQTLTVPLLSALWKYPIENYRFTITLPQNVEAYPLFSSGYYGEAVEDYITLAANETILSGVLNEPLRDHESLQMQMVLPAGYFTGHFSRWSGDWFSVLFVLLLSVLVVVYYLRTLRNPRLFTQTRRLPPDSVQPGDAPYLLAGGKPDFTMMIFYWASLGYLSVYAGKQGKVVLRRQMHMGNERRELEIRLFYTLFARGDVCDGASLQYKRSALKAEQVVRRFWDRRLYQKNSGSPLVMQLLCCAASAVAALESAALLLPMMTARWMLLVLSLPLGAALSFLVQELPAAWLLKEKTKAALGAASAAGMLLLCQPGGGALLMLLALGLSVLTGFAVQHGGKRSENGTRLIGQTLGYQQFLQKTDGEELHTLLKRDPQFFYKTLLYAEAFGFGEKYAEKFAVQELESCSWYQEAAPLPKTASAYYARWKETVALLKLSIRK